MRTGIGPNGEPENMTGLVKSVVVFPLTGLREKPQRP
jgi:hypothetical protein